MVKVSRYFIALLIISMMMTLLTITVFGAHPFDGSGYPNVTCNNPLYQKHEYFITNVRIVDTHYPDGKLCNITLDAYSHITRCEFCAYSAPGNPLECRKSHSHGCSIDWIIGLCKI